MPVPALAAETGWSGRHRTGRFRPRIGLTPKAAARVLRFSRARHLLAEHGFATDSELLGGRSRRAEPAGRPGRDLRYFDQAASGAAVPRAGGLPAEPWLAEAFRNVQPGTGWLSRPGRTGARKPPAPPRPGTRDSDMPHARTAGLPRSCSRAVGRLLGAARVGRARGTAAAPWPSRGIHLTARHIPPAQLRTAPTSTGRSRQRRHRRARRPLPPGRTPGPVPRLRGGAQARRHRPPVSAGRRRPGPAGPEGRRLRRCRRADSLAFPDSGRQRPGRPPDRPPADHARLRTTGILGITRSCHE